MSLGQRPSLGGGGAGLAKETRLKHTGLRVSAVRLLPFVSGHGLLYPPQMQEELKPNQQVTFSSWLFSHAMPGQNVI